MRDCPNCLCDQLYRSQRTLLERLVFAQVFECRICGHRAHVTRPRIAAAATFFKLRARRRSKQLWRLVVEGSRLAGTSAR
jgi:hypothetical protein